MTIMLPRSNSALHIDCGIGLPDSLPLGREMMSADQTSLMAWGFWRVLLDEAQLVAHSSSVAAQKASSLWRRHAWTVTGTPLSSRLSEIQVHLADGCPSP